MLFSLAAISSSLFECIYMCVAVPIQARWFERHKKQLPPTVIKIIEENETSPGGRQKNSDLINSVVMRSETGVYGWDLENPHVEDWSDKNKTSFNSISY